MANDDRTTELLLKAKNLTAEAFAEVSKALKEIEDKTESTTAKGKGHWGSLFGTIAGGVAVGNLISSAFQSAAGVLASVPGQLIELGKRGNDVADVRENFDKLNAAIGQTGGGVLAELRTAFGRTISDFDLMTSVNEGLSKGITLTGQEMATMAKATRVMSDQVGGDSREKFDSLMKSIASGQSKELKQLPVDYARIEKAVEAYALKLGVEESALTTSQRQQAMRNAVLVESRRILEANGEVQNDFNDNLAAASAQWQNLQDRVGEAIAQSPSLNVALGKAADALTAAFGPDRDTQIKTLSTLIANVAIAAVNSAVFVVNAAQSIATAYYDARAAVDSVFELLNHKQIAEAEQMVALYEGITARQGAASSQEKLKLQELRSKLLELKGYSEGLNKDAKAALDTNEKLKQMGEDAKKSLEQLKVEMGKAETAAKGSHAATDGLATSHRDAAGAAGLSAKAQLEQAQAAAKLTSAYKPLSEEMQLDIIQAAQVGLGAEDIAKRFGVTAIQVTRYLDAFKGAKEVGAAWVKTHEDIAAASHKFITASIDADNAQRRKELDAKGDALVKQHLASVEYHEKNYQLTLNATARTIRQFAIERDEKIRTLGDASGEIAQYYQHQIDLASGTADTIVERMHAAGVSTKQDLRDQAAAARRDYNQMRDSGVFTADAIAAAFVRANRAAAAARGETVATLTGISAMFTSLAQVVGGAAGSILQSLGGITDGLGRARQANIDWNGTASKGQGIASALFSDQASSADKWAAGIASATAIAGGAMKVWTATVNAAGRAEGAFAGAMSGAEAGAVFGGWGAAVGAAAGGVMGFIQGMTAGRRAIVAFAETFDTLASGDGFTELHARLVKSLGAIDGEQFWVELTQRIANSDGAGAARLIKQIQQSLANAPDAMAAAAGYKTIDELKKIAAQTLATYEYMRESGRYAASAVEDAFKKASDAAVAAMDSAAGAAYNSAIKARDAAQTVLDGINSQMKTLQAAVDAEAPEEFIGEVQRLQQEQLKALEEKRAKAAATVEDLNKKIDDAAAAAIEAARIAAEGAGESAVVAIREALARERFKIHVDADGFPWGGSTPPTASHADGAYVREDHTARVHAGEMIGHQDFFGNAFARALTQSGLSGRRGGPTVVQLVLDRRGTRVLAQTTLEDQESIVGSYGATRVRV